MAAVAASFKFEPQVVLSQEETHRYLTEEFKLYADQQGAPAAFTAFAARVLSTPPHMDITETAPVKHCKEWAFMLVDAFTLDSMLLLYDAHALGNLLRLFCADTGMFKALVQKHEDKSLGFLFHNMYFVLGEEVTIRAIATMLATCDDCWEMMQHFVVTAVCGSLVAEMVPRGMSGMSIVSMPWGGTVRIVAGILNMFRTVYPTKDEVVKAALAEGTSIAVDIASVSDASYSCLVGLLRACGARSCTGEWEGKVYEAMVTYENFHVMSKEDPEGLREAEAAMVKLYGGNAENL